MTLVERARLWAGTEDAKRVAVALRILFFAAMFTWLVLKVRARDMRHLEGVVERLAAEPFVARTRSTIVLSALVRRPEVPPAPTE